MDAAFRSMLISETRSREVRREHILYAVGAGGVALHTVDHLVSDLQRTLLFAGAVALAAFTIGLLPAYARLTPVAREVVDFVLGATWASAALVHHVFGLFVGGIAPTDFTGIAAAIGGGLIICAGLEARRQTERRPNAHEMSGSQHGIRMSPPLESRFARDRSGCEGQNESESPRRTSAGYPSGRGGPPGS